MTWRSHHSGDDLDSTRMNRAIETLASAHESEARAQATGSPLETEVLSEQRAALMKALHEVLEAQPAEIAERTKQQLDAIRQRFPFPSDMAAQRWMRLKAEEAELAQALRSVKSQPEAVRAAVNQRLRKVRSELDELPVEQIRVR